MSEITRFGVSLEKELLEKFDKIIESENYSNRSEAIRDLIREGLVKKEWKGNKEVVGIITLVYNHKKRELQNRLTDNQHHHHHLVLSSQHVHLDHDNCLEVIILKGKSNDIKHLFNSLKSTKGIKHSILSMTTTAKNIK